MKKINLFSIEKWKSHFPTKRNVFLSVVLMGFLLSGCLVKSLHPFYKPSDLIFRKDILGTYVDQEKGTWTIEQYNKKEFLSPDKPQSTYKITLLDEKKRTSTFIAGLFKLDNDYYVDFFPEGENNEDSMTELFAFHLIGVHTVAKVEIAKNSLHIKWYNEKWLLELFQQNKIRLPHENVSDDNAVVLTASTNDLQKFMRKFANDPNAFHKDEKNKLADYEFVLTRKQ